MAKIQVLDAYTISRIAAGEVVERPASAVKEFIENSLDAGATSVSVEIADGGLSLIRVADNGSGIPPEDVLTAFTRHATSKIRSGDELTRILTLGFRGEALPSVAAVSDMTIRTRVKGSDEGVEVTATGGRLSVPSPCGCPEGTVIEVRGLFKPTPARLKFMRRPTAEAGLVSDVVAKAILQRPDVAFKFISNKKPTLSSPGNGDLRTAVFCVWGRDTAEGLIPVSGQSGYVKLSGLIGVGEQGRPSRSRQWLYVCGRPVICPVISQGVERAAREQVLTGQYPSGVLKLEIPLDFVDINVHPNKLEVRFTDDHYVRDAVADIVAASLAAARAGLTEALAGPLRESAAVSHPPALAPASTEPPRPSVPVRADIPVVVIPARGAMAMRESPIMAAAMRYAPHQGASGSPPPAPEPQPEREPEQLPAVPLEEPPRVIAQLFNTYILIEHGDRMLIVDQHAAHERILYERFKKRLESGGASQPLLSPVVVTLSPREKQAVLDARYAFEGIGFELEDFGPADIKLTAVPHILGAPQLKSFFSECADDPDVLRAGHTPESLREKLVKHACRKAVKGGERLDPAEVTQLMRAAGEVPPTCPHGRPIYVVVSKRDLEKRFGRILP